MTAVIWLLFILLQSQCFCEEFVPKSTAAQPLLDAIPFVITGPETVQMPKDSLELKIAFNSSSQDTSNMTFYWEILEGSGFGTAEASYTKPVLTLVNLKEGTMRWRATVKSGEQSSYRDVTVSILPPKQPNRPPKARINPSSPVRAAEGNQVVLDAEGSTDEDGDSLEFEWKLVNGPTVMLPAMNTAILRLENLIAGNYSFQLIVKDKEGATDRGTVDVVVTKKRDDPPKAQISECSDLVARSTIDVRLPRQTLLLCANTSTDDFGIVSYKWFRVDNLTSQVAVDYSGSTTPVLSLTNLQPNEKIGPYVFSLEVTDAKGQKDSAKLSIMVNKAVNQAPVPYAGPNQTLILPVDSVILSGSVKDDGEIVAYQWTQLRGPNQIQFLNQDRIKCTAKGFDLGVYHFQLNVTDDGGLSAVADTYVEVGRSKNEPPIARAQNVTVYLPVNLAVLNGNESSDDAGVVSYLWTPHDDVPACITMLGNSYSQPVLSLAGLIPGKFLFDLTVGDASDALNTTTVQLDVFKTEELQNSVEMYMDENKANITYGLRAKLEKRMSSTILSQLAEATGVQVYFSDFAQEPTTGKLRAVFYAKYQTASFTHASTREATENPVMKVLYGKRAVGILRNEANMIREFHITSIDTLYCTLDCSGHGACSNFSKQCSCDRYWMPNLFHYFMSGGTHDCSWSLLYFGICVLVLGMLLPRLLICVICRRSNGVSKWNDNRRSALRRRKRRRFRKNGEDTALAAMNGNGKLNDQSSSYSLLMGSDSLSSDTEIDQMKETRVVEKKCDGLDEVGAELRERFAPVPLDL